MKWVWVVAGGRGRARGGGAWAAWLLQGRTREGGLSLLRPGGNPARQRVVSIKYWGEARARHQGGGGGPGPDKAHKEVLAAGSVSASNI